MAYSIFEIYTRDIDWFVSDEKFINIHAASGGGIIPNIIIQNNDLNEYNLNVALQAPQIFDNNEIELNPFLQEYIQLEKEEELEYYLSDFKDMAKRGFFSFDKTHLGLRDNGLYHLVASPKHLYCDDIIINQPLRVNFDILTILSNNKWSPFNIIDLINGVQ